MGSFTSEDHQSPAHLLVHFDIDLQRFYLEALQKELDVRNRRNAQDIKVALKEVVEAYKKQSGDGPCIAKSIRFDSPAKRCAYVLKHGPCFTSALARHLLRLVHCSPSIFHKLFLRGGVRLCCLGGGPASDAVAVCKILSAQYRPFWLECRQALKVKVTVVDVNEDWEITAGNVLATLKMSPELIGVEGVEVAFDFCKADLTQPIEGKVRRILEGADILTMMYFLSAVNGGKDKVESYQMVKEIMRCMKNESILLFLDSATDIHYKQMNSAAETLGNLSQIYGPRIEEFHTLSLDSVRKFLELYKRDFDKFLCLTNCFVSCSAWRKSETLLVDSSLVKKSQRLLVDMSLANKSENLLVDKSSMDQSLLNESEISLGDKSLMDKCTVIDHEEELLWRKSQRNAVSILTSKMVSFRAEIGRLLATEFEQFRDIENEIFDDVEESSDDTFDILLSGYFDSVPEYFFQTKSKKKRIFTGLPLSI